MHPVVLRAFAGDSEEAVVRTQQTQAHQAFDGVEFCQAVALQQHLATIGTGHQHGQLLPRPPAHKALIVETQLRGDEAHVSHFMHRRRRKMQACHGFHPLHPLEGT
ncbi:hypothetical protein D3C71_1541110 [compost metagenome]